MAPLGLAREESGEVEDVQTLETVLASGSDDVKNTARELIHKLGERGIHGMQDLLAPDQLNRFSLNEIETQRDRLPRRARRLQRGGDLSAVRREGRDSPLQNNPREAFENRWRTPDES